MLAGAHKKFYRIQHPEIYLLHLKVQYRHKIKLPSDTVAKPARQFGHAMQIQIIIIIHFFRNRFLL